MSIEKFPIKEKLATDLDTQIAWLVREMGYSRDKTKGYEEKLVRLSRHPEDDQSVFSFMGGYWNRFRISDDGLKEIPDQRMVNMSLQALAKVVAGLSDKVALSIWLDKKEKHEEYDVEELIDSALFEIRDKVHSSPNKYSDDDLSYFIQSKDFAQNPMGRAILNLHSTFESEPSNLLQLHEHALEGAVAGVLMWQHYAKGLSVDYSVAMPKPGLSSGNIEEW